MEYEPIYWAVYLFLFIVDFGLVGPPYKSSCLYQLLKLRCLALLLCSGAQRLVSWMPSASLRPSWASASSSHLSASPKPCPSYSLPAPSPQVVSSQQSCLKHEAKCCSKTNNQQWAAEHSWSVCVWQLEPEHPRELQRCPSHTNRTDCHPHCKPRILWNMDCIIQSLYMKSIMITTSEWQQLHNQVLKTSDPFRRRTNCVLQWG